MQAENWDKVEKIADLIAIFLRAKKQIDPKDICIEGINADEVRRYWALAYALAAVETEGQEA